MRLIHIGLKFLWSDKLKILIACSASKKNPPTENLIWSSNTDPESWLKEISEADTELLHPREMYTGRATKTQSEIVVNHGYELWFVSAGLGIINGNSEATPIPSYEASFSGINNGPDNDQWALMHSSSITQLEGQDRILLLLPTPYLRTIENHLLPMANRVTMFETNSPLLDHGANVVNLHPRIREAIGCAATDYWTEILRLVISNGINTPELIEMNTKARKLPDRPIRRRVNNDELTSLILDLPRSVNTASGAVRYIRDVFSVAAAQERIFAIWKKEKNNNH